MKIKETAKLSPMNRLIYWIKERESIRLKKEAGEPKPYTDDEILQRYRFCNVRRMDDKVSRWLYDNWYLPNYDHPSILVAATLARQLNNICSLASVGFPYKWNPKAVESVLNNRVKKGLKNFGSAYMITGTLGGTKIQQVVHKVVTPLVLNGPEIDRSSMENTATSLLPYAGFSHFIAGQVVADLRWAMKGSWLDRMTWASIGPGSRRGINILLGRPMDQLMKQSEFTEYFLVVMEGLKRKLPSGITKRLEAHDYQNCLCEFFKYTKTLLGLGRPKQLYDGAL